MSQHCFPTTCHGEPVFILMGWDRPLQGYFLVIKCEHRDALLYSNLEDHELRQCMGMPRSLDHFLKRLSEFGVQVPSRMLNEIKADAKANVGNRYVVYDAAGHMTTEC